MTTSQGTLVEVFERLAEEGLVEAGDHGHGFAQRLDEALAGNGGEDAPWYVHLFVGLGTWIGAIIAASFLAIVGLLDDPGEAGVLGVLMFVAAMVVGRRSSGSVLMTQLTWVLALGAQMALYAAFVEFDEEVLLVGVILQVLSFAAIPLPLFRFVATVAGVAFLAFWLFLREVPLGLEFLVVVVMAACLTIWLFECQILAGRSSRLWTPVAFGLPTGLVAPLVLLTVIARWGWHEETVSHPLPISLALGLLGAWILVVATREMGGRSRPQWIALCALGLLVVVALTHEVPGIVASFLLLALAHLRRDRWLEGIAFVELGLFLTLFYYSLDTPLLHKSMWIGLTGVVLLALAVALHVLTRARSEAPGTEGVGLASIVAIAAARRRPLLLALFLALALPAVSVLHKESVLAQGQTVLLELRPVDPRSLMQGDFMILSYALQQEVFELERLDGGDLPRSGKLVLGLDASGVATLVGENRAAAPGEIPLVYRIRDRRWGGRDLRLGAESFFFEEGSAELYADAKYGELRVAPSGTAVLVGLRDAERQPLGRRLHGAQGGSPPPK